MNKPMNKPMNKSTNKICTSQPIKAQRTSRTIYAWKSGGDQKSIKQTTMEQDIIQNLGEPNLAIKEKILPAYPINNEPKTRDGKDLIKTVPSRRIANR